MDWQSTVERTVVSLGYELVDLERSSGGLLRVFIDRPPGTAQGEAAHASAGAIVPAGAGAPEAPVAPSITVGDCERVTRALQYELGLEGVDYQRLEVSSPGLDRPLKKLADWQRFAGSRIDLTLRAPLGGRRHFSGELRCREDGWRLVFSDQARGEQALDFSLDEVREARLVPVFDFKGRRARAAGPERRPNDES